jgi:outer membrane cobalamin receptor
MTRLPRFSFLPFIFLVVFSRPLTAQIGLFDTTVTDTMGTESLDTLARYFIQPIPLVGSIDPTLPSTQVITDSALNFMDYEYAGDLLTMMPGEFVRDFGTPGQWQDFTLQGLGEREQVFLSDGIRVNSPLLGVYDLNLYPTENIERIELVQGTRSFVYGLNGTGGSVNFVSKSKKAIHPQSRIRYSEASYGYSLVDGMVSQDVIRGLNVTAGANHTTFGPEFSNDSYDHWNARMKARYNISNEINVFASETYNQTKLGLNGGINIDTTSVSFRFDRLQAIPLNTDAYEKITRHDAQVGIAGCFASDSNAVNTLTLYISSELREYRDEENRPNPNGIFIQQNQWSQWMGAKLTEHRTIGDQQLDVGAEIQSQRALITPATNESRAVLVSAFSRFAFAPTEIVSISPYARFDNYKHQHKLGYGADATVHLSQCSDLFGGYSRSYRFPTFQERLGTQPVLSSSLIDDAPEQHSLFEGGFRWTFNDNLSLQLQASHRTISEFITVGPQTSMDASAPYEFTRHSQITLNGGSGSASFRLGSFFFDGNAQFLERTDNSESHVIFPKWTATGGAYYWDTLFSGHLNLRTGVRARFFSSFHSLAFNQQTLVFVPGGQSYDIANTSVVDLVLIGRIGSAYIHVIWDNILDVQYVMTSFYPMPERQLRFGVSWDFVD